MHTGRMGLTSGPVTLLFTDIEGSIRLWEAAPEAMAEASGRHNRIVREQVEVSGGHVLKTGFGIWAGVACRTWVALSGSSR